MDLQALWILQEKDLALASLQQKIDGAPASSGIEALLEEITRLEEDIASRGSWLKEEKKSQKSLELSTQKIADHRRQLQESMYDGTVSNVKELEQMQKKMELLAREKEGLEDKIIAHMERIEELENMLNENRSHLKTLQEELSEKQKRLAKELEGMEAEKQILVAEREKVASTLDQKQIDRYLLIEERHQGHALAAVKGDICSGCRVFISSAQRGYLYNPEAMVYCENCGRLLVRLIK